MATSLGHTKVVTLLKARPRLHGSFDKFQSEISITASDATGKKVSIVLRSGAHGDFRTAKLLTLAMELVPKEMDPVRKAADSSLAMRTIAAEERKLALAQQELARKKAALASGRSTEL